LRTISGCTIAARDNEDSRLGGDPYDVSTIILRIRGDELASYRAGRITKQDVLKRVQVRSTSKKKDEGGNNWPDPVSKRVEYAPMRTRFALVLLAALVATSCSSVDLKTSSRLDPPSRAGSMRALPPTARTSSCRASRSP
jgi:hypothetical protein